MFPNKTELNSILDEMRKSLIVADFLGLAVLAPKLDQALAAFSPADAKSLLQLKAKADHNASLLEAARRGIGAARRRLDEARLASKGLQTYDDRGRRLDVTCSEMMAGRF